MQNNKYIIIIDDNKIDCFINQKIATLANKNVKTKIFLSGFDALDYFKTLLKEPEIKSHFIPDLILLDINMPIINGFDFLRELAKTDLFKKKPIDVYFLSSSNNKKDIKEGLEIMFCTGYIIKPLTKDKLNKLAESKQKQIII